MPQTCAGCNRNPVDIIRSLKGSGLSDKAKLVAILEAWGVTDREQVESDLEAAASTIRHARQALKIQRSKSSDAGNRAPEIQRSAGNRAQTLEIERQKSSVPSCARATKESLRDTSFEDRVPPPTPQPSPEPSACGGVGEDTVTVVGKTIRHPAFVVSLPAIELGTVAAGYSPEQIRTHCMAHALQWAAEIDSGRKPADVLPSRIANFLSTSIMAGKLRADVAETRMSHPPKSQPGFRSHAEAFTQLRAEGYQ